MVRPSMRGGVPVLRRAGAERQRAQPLGELVGRRIAGAAAGVVVEADVNAARRGRCRR